MREWNNTTKIKYQSSLMEKSLSKTVNSTFAVALCFAVQLAWAQTSEEQGEQAADGGQEQRTE